MGKAQRATGALPSLERVASAPLDEPDTCDTLEIPADPDPPLAAGDLVDRYRVVRLMATGGMARVYEATHEWTHRSVALKIMHARYGCRSDVIERFRKEAMALSAITHPNVVTVENGGLTEGGLVFLATELLSGQSLREVLRARRSLPLHEALSMLIQVARGVAAAHAENVIHRDLKPENIFCTSTGTAKVLDLGIAKLIGYDAKETDPNAGFIAGTPAYMAPELLDAKPAGPSVDVYALGVVAYECLAGCHPLTPDGTWPSPAELARRVLVHQPLPLTQVPAELAKVIERAMHKHAARRHASMGELAGALEEVEQALLRRAAPDSAKDRAVPGPRAPRRRSLTPILVLTLLVVLGAGAASVHWARSSQSPTTQAALLSAARPAAEFVAVNTSGFLVATKGGPLALNGAEAPALGLPAEKLANAVEAASPLKARARRRAPSRLISRTFSVDSKTAANRVGAPLNASKAPARTPGR